MCLVIFLAGTSQLVLACYRTNSSKYRDGSKNPATLKKDVFLTVFNPLKTEAVSYRNQSIDLLCKSMDWFLYDNGLCLEQVSGWKGLLFSQKAYFRCAKVYYVCLKSKSFVIVFLLLFSSTFPE